MGYLYSSVLFTFIKTINLQIQYLMLYIFANEYMYKGMCDQNTIKSQPADVFLLTHLMVNLFE